MRPALQKIFFWYNSTMFDNRRIKFISVCIVCAVLGFYAAKALFDHIAEAQSIDEIRSKPRLVAKKAEIISTPVPPKPKKQLPEEIKKSPQPALVLNGIVLSPELNYALINNKIVKEGDKIEGITVIRITKDSVELKEGDKSFRISPNAKSF